jgi:hypothetical protein
MGYVSRHVNNKGSILRRKDCVFGSVRHRALDLTSEELCVCVSITDRAGLDHRCGVCLSL